MAQALSECVRAAVFSRSRWTRFRGQGHEKTKRIAKIKRAGKEPRIEILRHGLTEEMAAHVEAAAIDLLGLPILTNALRGEKSTAYGRAPIEEIITWAAPPANITHSTVLITINQRYRHDMPATALYEATRGVWVIGERREKAELAMAVFGGVVREVYRVRAWHPAGTLPYSTREDAHRFKGCGRW
jgi:hypothetical protein